MSIDCGLSIRVQEMVKTIYSSLLWSLLVDVSSGHSKIMHASIFLVLYAVRDSQCVPGILSYSVFRLYSLYIY